MGPYVVNFFPAFQVLLYGLTVKKYHRDPGRLRFIDEHGGRCAVYNIDAKHITAAIQEPVDLFQLDGLVTLPVGQIQVDFNFVLFFIVSRQLFHFLCNRVDKGIVL